MKAPLFTLMLVTIIDCVIGFFPILLMQKRKNVIQHFAVKTCFYEEDDYDKNEKMYNKLINSIEFVNIPPYSNKSKQNESFYTLIWYDCKDCKELIETLEEENKKIIYINGSYYFYDTEDKQNKGKPLLYKDDEFVSDDLFDIYFELFR